MHVIKIMHKSSILKTFRFYLPVKQLKQSIFLPDWQTFLSAMQYKKHEPDMVIIQFCAGNKKRGNFQVFLILTNVYIISFTVLIMTNYQYFTQ